MKAVENTTINGKLILCFLTRRIAITNTSMLSQTMYRFWAFAMKILMAIYTEIDKSGSQICTKPQKTCNSQSVLDKE